MARQINLEDYNINNNFDENLFLNDNNLIITQARGSGGTSGNIVINFRKNNTNFNVFYPYVATINGQNVYFDENGISKDGTIQVVVADCNIDNETIGNDNALTKSVNNEIITISLNSLNFREQVALNVLNKFLEKEENSYIISDARIKMLITRAFDYAQEFMNQSANHRAADTVSTEPIYKVEIVNDDISSS